MKIIRVLMLTRYGRIGSSSRVRAHQYVPYLRSAGFDVVVSSLLTDEYVVRLYAGRRPGPLSVARRYLVRLRRLLAASEFDVLWIEKEALPWLPAGWELRLLSRAGVPFVVDYDDAVFLGYEEHRKWIVRALLGDRIERIMRAAAVVAVGNPNLGDRARAAGATTVVEIPSAVDVDEYLGAPRRAAEPRALRIGWMGSPPTDPFLDLVVEPLRSVCRQHDAQFLCVGSTRTLPGVPTLHATWSEETEREALAQMDVGIMPLPDTAFTRGKCGYKLIQYMASSLPVVASPVGVNRTLVQDGVNGFLAASDDEWKTALTKLLRDRPLRGRLGANGRRLVETRYSTAFAAPILVDVLRTAVCQAAEVQ